MQHLRRPIATGFAVQAAVSGLGAPGIDAYPWEFVQITSRLRPPPALQGQGLKRINRSRLSLKNYGI